MTAQNEESRGGTVVAYGIVTAESTERFEDFDGWASAYFRNESKVKEVIVYLKPDNGDEIPANIKLRIMPPELGTRMYKCFCCCGNFVGWLPHKYTSSDCNSCWMDPNWR